MCNHFEQEHNRTYSFIRCFHKLNIGSVCLFVSFLLCFKIESQKKRKEEPAFLIKRNHLGGEKHIFSVNRFFIFLVFTLYFAVRLV